MVFPILVFDLAKLDELIGEIFIRIMYRSVHYSSIGKTWIVKNECILFLVSKNKLALFMESKSIYIMHRHLHSAEKVTIHG